MVTNIWPPPHHLSQIGYRRPLPPVPPNAVSRWFRPPAFQQNWPFPANFPSAHYLLYRYLPLLVQVVYDYKITLDEASEQLASGSSGIEENGSFPGLDGEVLLDAYVNIIHIVTSSPNHHVASATIRNRLSVGMVEVGRSYRHHPSKRYYSTLLLFRACAEISRQTESRCLGTVLSSFFLMNATSLLVYDFEILVLWSHSIYRSAMDYDEKHTCLALIVAHFPELIDELRMMRTRPAELLYPPLASIANDIGVRDPRFRGRTRHRLQEWGDDPDDIVPSPRIPRRLGGGWRSYTPSPNRRMITDSRDFFEPAGDLILRPRSAPGVRSIARQADRVMESAQDTMIEAANLKALTR